MFTVITLRYNEITLIKLLHLALALQWAMDSVISQKKSFYIYLIALVSIYNMQTELNGLNN